MLSYWFGESPHKRAATQDDGTGYGMRVGYQPKAWEAAAAGSKTTYRNMPEAAAATSGGFATWNVATSYDFGLAKLMVTGARKERSSVIPAGARGWLLAAAAAFRPHEFRPSVGEDWIDACTAFVSRMLQWGIG